MTKIPGECDPRSKIQVHSNFTYDEQMTYTGDESTGVSDVVDKIDEYMTEDEVEVEERGSDSIGKAGIMGGMAKDRDIRRRRR